MPFKIPGLKGATVRQVGKYLINRLRGVKYGAVRTKDGIQLRKTSTLEKFTYKMDTEGYTFEHIKPITPEQAENYAKRAGTKLQIDPNGHYYHSQEHGTSQILKDNENLLTDGPILDLVEHLAHPTRTFLKITLYNALKNM